MPLTTYSDDMEHEFEIGDFVKPATEQDVHVLQSGFTRRINIHTKFKVCVIVEDAKTYRGKESGLIVGCAGQGRNVDVGRDSFCYPYVWDAKRFVKA